MTRKPFFLLSMLLLGAACVLLFLVTTAGRPNDNSNGFARQGLHGHKAIYRHELAVGETLYKICGATAHRFFFTGRDPRVMHPADFGLKRLAPQTIPFPLSNQVLVAYDIKVDSPYVRLYANNLSTIYSSRFDDTSIHSTRLPTRLFTAIVPLSAQCVVARAFDSSGEHQLFKKIYAGASKPAIETTILAYNNDAGFSADGMLRYDSSTHRILFVQFYQNRFFCLDTNLHLIYTGKTIDTTNTNPVSTRHLPSRPNKGSLLPDVPLHIINWACTTDGRYIYIQSTLKADNELAPEFEKNAVVDVYNLSNGRYRRSFYIPDLHNEKAQNLFFVNGLLLVSYTGYIGAFEIPDR
ncbi:MAG TPA: hypothetical protein VLD19_01365 [Chitinophagaceae bacterium]|nr:hypothetical protein [Chitinophagaceae bacterium]